MYGDFIHSCTSTVCSSCWFCLFLWHCKCCTTKKSSMAIAFRTQRMKDEECLLVGVLVCMHEYTFALSFRGKNWNTYWKCIHEDLYLLFFALIGIDKEALAKARASLLNNKVISIPTDTIYGVTGLAQSTQAVKKIYEIKSRSFTNPIAICVGEIEEIKR